MERDSEGKWCRNKGNHIFFVNIRNSPQQHHFARQCQPRGIHLFRILFQSVNNFINQKHTVNILDMFLCDTDGDGGGAVVGMRSSKSA